MGLKKYLLAMRKMNPSRRKIQSLRENCERMDGIRDMCIGYGLPFGFFNNPGVRKTMTRFTLDLAGEQEPGESFRDCDCANNTVVLHEGRMYPCEIIPTVRHFNRYFNQNLSVAKNDSIDIHGAESMGEILSFLAKPVPFCRYCDVKKRIRGIGWNTTRGTMSEWICGNPCESTF